MRMYNPPHPGRVVKEAVEAIPMSITDFADHLGVSRVTLSRVLNCRAAISPEMSIRLSQAFDQQQPDIWFRMQNAYDFSRASQPRRKPVRPLNNAA
jgi:addiction module HigA family antidote